MKICKHFVFIVLIAAFASCDNPVVRESIVGNWTCNEVYGSENNTTFSVSIEPNFYSPNNTNSFIIMNFHNIGYDSGNEVIVEEVETGKLTIMGSPQHISFSGTGEIDPNFETITWNYKVTDGATNPEVRALFY